MMKSITLMMFGLCVVSNWQIETLGVICYYERKGISKEVFEKIIRDLKRV